MAPKHIGKQNMKRRKYEEWEKDFVRLAYPLSSCKEIGEILNRSEKTIMMLISSVLKIQKKKNKVREGQRFGKLLVLKEEEKRGNNRIWLCLCDCGKHKIQTSHKLLRGNQSCGCQRIISITKGNNIISGVWYGKIKGNAKKRNLDFSVSLEYLTSLFKKQNAQCSLSGLEIKIPMGRYDSVKTTASLDRIDNNKGYIPGNVQFVHKNINYMKSIYDQKYFIALCKKVAQKNEQSDFFDCEKYDQRCWTDFKRTLVSNP